jgi:hypothetical protein
MPFEPQEQRSRAFVMVQKDRIHDTGHSAKKPRGRPDLTKIGARKKQKAEFPKKFGSQEEHSNFGRGERI